MTSVDELDDWGGEDDQEPPVEGRVMTEAETDRVRITSWWASFTYRDRPDRDAATVDGEGN